MKTDGARAVEVAKVVKGLRDGRGFLIDAALVIGDTVLDTDSTEWAEGLEEQAKKINAALAPILVAAEERGRREGYGKCSICKLSVFVEGAHFCSAAHVPPIVKEAEQRGLEKAAKIADAHLCDKSCQMDNGGGCFACDRAIAKAIRSAIRENPKDAI